MDKPTSRQAFQTILVISFLDSQPGASLMQESVIQATIDPECFDLGNVYDLGWSLGAMLEQLLALCEPWQRDMLEGDDIVIPFRVWNLMHGDPAYSQI